MCSCAGSVSVWMVITFIIFKIVRSVEGMALYVCLTCAFHCLQVFWYVSGSRNRSCSSQHDPPGHGMTL